MINPAADWNLKIHLSIARKTTADISYKGAQYPRQSYAHILLPLGNFDVKLPLSHFQNVQNRCQTGTTKKKKMDALPPIINPCMPGVQPRI